MAKQSEKPAADKQPESQRGKSRFGVQPRSNRVVLPDRPPREIDNEIVSILLGGDPSSLSASVSEESNSPIVAAPPPAPAVISPPIEDPRSDKNPDIFSAEAPLHEVKSAPSSKTHPSRVKNSPTRISPVLEPLAERSTPQIESTPSVSTRGISDRSASLPRSGVDRSAKAPAENIQDPTIASFEEFSERWKHGLRKGQLKVCEVLYQKTYALGETECITSFSELGRLSGLKMRQCFNIIAQLEALRFVERAKSNTTSNKKDQGSIIRFYLFPKN